MCLMITSSVARGAAEGGSSPHWPEKYAKNTFLGAFEASFCSKNENSPPMGLASRICEGLAVIWTRKVEFFFWTAPIVVQENSLNLGEDLFFFWRSPNLDRKKRFNFGKDLFFEIP